MNASIYFIAKEGNAESKSPDAESGFVLLK